jgi:tRNA pseudouridine32 synthase / 23S rRNA pseudouridine746 synthase
MDWDKLVIWQDESLLAVNKPAGLLSLPDGYDPQALHLRGVLEPIYGRLWTVHRLDRETSGVVVLARSAAAHRALNTQFEQRQVTKIYHAVVAGIPDWELITIDLPLRVDVGHRHRTVVDAEKGKAAVTHFRRLKAFADSSLVEISPATGRTHQIRAHLAALGLTIVGDLLYGSGTSLSASISRIMLHACRLELAQPATGESLSLEAPYPVDFVELLATLATK